MAGLLSCHSRAANVLLEHGFEVTDSNVDGTFGLCYEKFIELSSLYDAFVSVRTAGDSNDEGHIYLEYSCGGEVAVYDTAFDASFEDQPQEFFEELDNWFTNAVHGYADVPPELKKENLKKLWCSVDEIEQEMSDELETKKIAIMKDDRDSVNIYLYDPVTQTFDEVRRVADIDDFDMGELTAKCAAFGWIYDFSEHSCLKAKQPVDKDFETLVAKTFKSCAVAKPKLNITITETKIDRAWHLGTLTIEGFPMPFDIEFEAEVFDEPSYHGLNGFGKCSQLWVACTNPSSDKSGQWYHEIIHYIREWDHAPADNDYLSRQILSALTEKYN